MEIDEERFMQLCKEAIAARDRDSLARIIRDINRMLYEKKMRLDDLRTNEQIVAGRNWDARFQGTGLPEAR